MATVQLVQTLHLLGRRQNVRAHLALRCLLSAGVGAAEAHAAIADLMAGLQTTVYVSVDREIVADLAAFGINAEVG